MATPPSFGPLFWAKKMSCERNVCYRQTELTEGKRAPSACRPGRRRHPGTTVGSRPSPPCCPCHRCNLRPCHSRRPGGCPRWPCTPGTWSPCPCRWRGSSPPRPGSTHPASGRWPGRVSCRLEFRVLLTPAGPSGGAALTWLGNSCRRVFESVRTGDSPSRGCISTCRVSALA